MPRRPVAARVYDALASEYGEHRTSAYFSALQDVPIAATIYRHVGRDRREKKALVVGVGDINTHMRQLNHHLDPTGFRPDNVTLLDISVQMLGQPARKRWAGNANRVQGDANKLHEYFKPKTFDLVLAALSDHLDNHPAFYRAARRVLRPGGVLVVSYPAREIMHAIRTRLYGIPANQTRFRVGNREYRLRSTLHTPAELRRLLAKAGFNDVSIEEIKHDDSSRKEPTEIIRKGLELLGKKLHDTPIVLLAAARKPAKRKVF